MIDSKEVKSRINIKELLLRLGAKETGHPNLSCPFHSSKNGQSLSYDESKGIFSCASPHCKAKAGGDIFNAVSIAENLDIKSEFPIIVKRVCEIAGIDPPIQDLKEKEDYEISLKRKVTITECHDYFFTVCCSNWETDEGKEVLQEVITKRGYSAEYIKDKLGYFPIKDSKKTIDELFTKSGGLQSETHKGKKYFANTFHAFKGRIIHPHFYRGKILHFTGEKTKFTEEQGGGLNE